MGMLAAKKVQILLTSCAACVWHFSALNQQPSRQDVLDLDHLPHVSQLEYQPRQDSQLEYHVFQ